MKFIEFIPLLLLLFLWNCENFLVKEVDPPKIATTPQLVVHCYLSPQDTAIAVSVTLSSPTFARNSLNTNAFTLVKNATVNLSDQSNTTISIPYNNEARKYQISAKEFQIKEQKIYYLSVSTPDGKKVSSSCIIPGAISNEIQNIRFHEKQDGYTQFSFEFTDEPNVQNFYRAIANVKYPTENLDSVLYERTYGFDLFTDKNKDGQKILAKSSEVYHWQDEIRSIKIQLLSVDENYYQYVKSSISQYDSDDLGPFSEPIIIRSNIENGLGVFCGYTLTEKTKIY